MHVDRPTVNAFRTGAFTLSKQGRRTACVRRCADWELMQAPCRLERLRGVNNCGCSANWTKTVALYVGCRLTTTGL
eukprot:244751-Prymnesium_polylepis.1